MTNDEMRLVDELRGRLNASYEEAAAALRESGGDVVQALAVIERRRREQGEGLVNVSNELIEEVKRLASEGVARKLRIKLGERPVAEISVTFGQAAAVVLSVAALLLSRMVIEVIREPAEAAEQASA
jgi:hypothetical protein